MSRLKRFLEYVATETISGRGGRLKGVVIAHDVFDKTDPDEAQSTTIVRVEAGRLRRRLDDYYRREGKNDPLRIRIPKGGYAVIFEKSTEETQHTDTQTGKTNTIDGWRAVLIPVLLLIIAIGLVAFAFYWNSHNTIGGAQTAENRIALKGSKPLIAVLPFKNMVSEDPDDSIAYGLTEDIITDLGKLPTIEVISLTSLLPFKDMDINPQDISSKLGAHYIMNGSVRGTPPDFRITAQLYDAINGVQIWAERFDRQMSSELVLQGELAARLVDSLSTRLQIDGNRTADQRGNTDPETWSLFKQAMSLVNPPSDPARLELSLKAFEQIARQDPEFAGGFAGIAYVHAFKAFFGHEQPTEYNVKTALEMAERAQNLDPSFGLSYTAQAFAFLVSGEFDRALDASGNAMKLAPNNPYVVTYHGFILCAAGYSEEGITFVEKALRLDPLNARTPYLNILGVANLFAGHYEIALQAFLENQERGGPLGPGIQYFVAASYKGLGDNTRAKATLILADLLTGTSFNWENWVRQSWKNPEDSDHILGLIEQIRKDGD